MNEMINSVIEKWTIFWNTYNLDSLDELFLSNSEVTYFSSEKKGVIKGIEEIREHHRNFGFITGGKDNNSKLWLEDINITPLHKEVVVTAIWFFQKDIESKRIQQGPVTMVLTPIEERIDKYRIAHMHFANY